MGVSAKVREGGYLPGKGDCEVLLPTDHRTGLHRSSKFATTTLRTKWILLMSMIFLFSAVAWILWLIQYNWMAPRRRITEHDYHYRSKTLLQVNQLRQDGALQPHATTSLFSTAPRNPQDRNAANNPPVDPDDDEGKWLFCLRSDASTRSSQASIVLVALDIDISDNFR
eukprot:3521875-Rhodomonas_salina.3